MVCFVSTRSIKTLLFYDSDLLGRLLSVPQLHSLTKFLHWKGAKCEHEMNPAQKHSVYAVDTWDVVDLATAVMLQSVAATTATAAATATVLCTGHPHEATSH